MKQLVFYAALVLLAGILVAIATYIFSGSLQSQLAPAVDTVSQNLVLREALSDDNGRRLCAKVAPILGLNLESRIVPPPPSAPVVKEAVDLLEFYTEDEQSIAISKDNGELRRYTDLKSENVPENLTKQDGISEQDALAIARKLLDGLGIALDNGKGVRLVLGDKSVRYEDYHDSKPQDLLYAYWKVTAMWSYNGVPVLGGVTLTISAYSGRIRKFALIPFQAPPSTEQKVSEDQAVGIARGFAENRGYEVKGDTTAALLVLAPNNFWTKGPDEPLVFEDRMLLCWWVSLPSNPSRMPLMVAVDAQSGEVVGGVI